MIELSIIRAENDSDEAFDLYFELYFQKLVRMVVNNILEKMRKMASIIQVEATGQRKEKMILAYDKLDEELSKWQTMKRTDILCELDK